MIQSGATVEDQIVAVLHLGEKQAMLTARLVRSWSVKNGVKAASHFWPHVNRSRLVSESANSCKRPGSLQFRKALEHC